jgi:8-oxo-dGTP pyrophosphatase MutT (NUDIX family)
MRHDSDSGMPSDTVPVVIDTVAWVHLDNGRILCARPRGKDIFYIPGGKREGAESDLQTLLREIAEELAVALLPETVRHVATYEAGQVRMMSHRTIKSRYNDGSTRKTACPAPDSGGGTRAPVEPS